MSSALTLRFFGGFEARVDGVSIPSLRSRKGEWLLALLALRCDRDTSREWLAETLWPDSDPVRAHYNLRRSLTDLRQALGAAAERLVAPAPRALRLQIGSDACDLLDFDRAVARGDWNRAVELYRGRLLEDCAEPWAVAERSRRELEYLGARERLAAAALRQNAFPTAEGHLQAILHIDPLRESAVRMQMEAQAAAGHAAAVTETFRRFRNRLRQDLNAEPDPETVLQYEAWRQGKRVAALPAGLRALPVSPTRFFGRERELEQGREALARSRLVTLVGPGGMGKTRLALALLDQVGASFERVWFVSLRDVGEADRFAEAVRDQLGLSRATVSLPLDQIAFLLQDRLCLMVLDNMEHLLPDVAPVVERLLQQAPGLRLIVTSRLVLHLPGESLLPLPPLEDEAGKDLFIDRARLRRSDFAPAEGTEDAVRELCVALDGIPLAIEIAAAWTHLLSPRQLYERTARRFSLLIAHHDGFPARHQSLERVLDESCQLLPEDTRSFFARLSVFRGGWTLEAAEAVGGADDTLAALSRLHDAALIVVEERDGEMRSRFLETIRAFAAERLSPTEREEAQRDHAGFFQALATEAAAHLCGPEQSFWMKRLDADLENLRAARAFLSSDPAAAARFATTLFDYWFRGEYLDEAHRELQAILRERDALPRSLADEATLQLAFFHRHLGEFDKVASLLQDLSLPSGNDRGRGLRDCLMAAVFDARGEWERAEESYRTALQAARASGDSGRLAVVLVAMGRWFKDRARYDEARRCLDEALAVLEVRGDLFQRARAFQNLGNVCRETGDWRQALAAYTRVQEIAERIGREAMGRWPQFEMGVIAFYQAQYEESRRHFAAALAASQASGDLFMVANALSGMGCTEVWQGRCEGLARIKEALRIWSGRSHWRELAYSLEAVAWANSRCGDPVLGARLFGAADALRRRIGVLRSPDSKAAYEAMRSEAETALGDAFAAAFAEGGAWEAERAVRAALTA